MKQVIITDSQTIESIVDELNWLQSEAERLITLLKNNCSQDNAIQNNINIYEEHIMDSCNIIRDLIEIS